MKSFMTSSILLIWRERELYRMRDEFHPYETHPARYSYLVFNIVNCTMKLCSETDLCIIVHSIEL